MYVEAPPTRITRKIYLDLFRRRTLSRKREKKTINANQDVLQLIIVPFSEYVREGGLPIEYDLKSLKEK